MGRQPFQDEGDVVTVVTVRTRAEYWIARPRKEKANGTTAQQSGCCCIPAHPNSIFIIMLDGTFFTAAITPTHDRVTEQKLLIGQYHRPM
jgi:hypothetical protein